MSTTRDDYGIVVVGHGTREAGGVREFEQLVELICQHSGGRVVTCGQR